MSNAANTYNRRLQTTADGNPLEKRLYALNGTVTVSTTDSVTGLFYAICCPFGDVTIESINLTEQHEGESNWANRVLVQGTVIDYITFTSITFADTTPVILARL